MQTHPAVQESLVFGMKEPSVQELVSAVIVLKPDVGIGSTKVLTDNIVQFVDDKVDADYKRLRGKILVRDSLPRNTAGKLLRREMRKWAEEEANKEEIVF